MQQNTSRPCNTLLQVLGAMVVENMQLMFGICLQAGILNHGLYESIPS
jgi:hypothetical protein